MYSLFGIWEEFHSPLKQETAPYKFRALVYVIPLLLSIGALLTDFIIDYNALRLIIPAISLFVGLLTNSVILLLRYSDTNNPSENLIDQTRNISIYLIVSGIFIVALSIGGYFSSLVIDDFVLIAKIYSAIIVFLLSHYLFSIFLLPARLFVIIENSSKTSPDCD